MSTPVFVLEEALKRYNASAAPPEPEPRSLSPELILVLPPEEAQAARALLPDREPFEDWLERLRIAEPAAQEPDWEFERSKMRSRAGGVLFAAACIANAVVPILLTLLLR